MTEVEFSHLLSQLNAVAEILNHESNSINGIIEQFETQLRKANIGIQVQVDIPEAYGTQSCTFASG